jgi:hypothetical protein
LLLRDQWLGYPSNTYSVLLSGDSQGYVDLQSLACHIGRSIVHFMEVNAPLTTLPYNAGLIHCSQTNSIRLSRDRVVISRLEEVNPGTWIPLLLVTKKT